MGTSDENMGACLQLTPYESHAKFLRFSGESFLMLPFSIKYCSPLELRSVHAVYKHFQLLKKYKVQVDDSLAAKMPNSSLSPAKGLRLYPVECHRTDPAHRLINVHTIVL